MTLGSEPAAGSATPGDQTASPAEARDHQRECDADPAPHEGFSNASGVMRERHDLPGAVAWGSPGMANRSTMGRPTAQTVGLSSLPTEDKPNLRERSLPHLGWANHGLP